MAKKVKTGIKSKHTAKTIKSSVVKKAVKKVDKNKRRSCVSKNETLFTTDSETSKRSVRELEKEILFSTEIKEIDIFDNEKKEKYDSKPSRDMLEQIMFKLPYVTNPLIGTPKDVQKTLDSLVKKMQREPDKEDIFNKIHLYIHGYLINVVLKKFPFIRGLQTVDVYQETLIALRFKAIPNFKRNKGMSFLNFAKMCIRRHLITLLNASKNRKKDQTINRSVSIDTSPIRDDDENRGTYANIIPDNKESADKEMEGNEAYEVTKKTLFSVLSGFERKVLNEYLASSSYDEISKNISVALKNKYNTKSIDNALLRIRKKAMHLLRFGKKEDLPIFMLART
jgi:RNA polymerase sporulation-specific sigma factor